MMKWLWIFLLVILLISCTHGQKVEPVKKTSAQLPDYVSNPPMNTTFFRYATGSGRTDKEAEENARASMLKQINDYVSSEYSSVEEELQIGDKSYYKSYTNDKLKTKTYGRIAGIQIQKKDHVDGTFYCLAVLNVEEFQASQKEIENKIRMLVEKAKSLPDAGLQLREYIFASSYLSQVLLPFKIDYKPEYVFFKTAIDDILQNISIEASVSTSDNLAGGKELQLTFTSNGNVLSSIPFLLPDGKHIPDENGIVFLDFNQFCPDNNDFTIQLIPKEIPIDSNLQREEEIFAKNLRKNLLKFEKSVHINCPHEYFVWLDINYLEDGMEGSNSIYNQFKPILANKENWFITTQRSKANVVVSINVEVNHSSSNEYLGECYKSGGSIQFTSSFFNRKVIDLTDSNTLEETKVFHKDKKQAIAQSREKLLQKMKREIKKYMDEL